MEAVVRFNLNPSGERCPACGAPHRAGKPVWAFVEETREALCEDCLERENPASAGFLAWCYRNQNRAAGRTMSDFTFQTHFEIWSQEGLIRVEAGNGVVLIRGRDPEELGRLFTLTSLWMLEEDQSPA